MKWIENGNSHEGSGLQRFVTIIGLDGLVLQINTYGYFLVYFSRTTKGVQPNNEKDRSLKLSFLWWFFIFLTILFFISHRIQIRFT
jgi:hypothetical protein